MEARHIRPYLVGIDEEVKAGGDGDDPRVVCRLVKWPHQGGTKVYPMLSVQVGQTQPHAAQPHVLQHTRRVLDTQEAAAQAHWRTS
jgi:hypothetical protein